MEKEKFSNDAKDALLLSMSGLITICQNEDKSTIEFAFIEHALLLLRKVVIMHNDYYKFDLKKEVLAEVHNDSEKTKCTSLQGRNIGCITVAEYD